MYNNKLINTKWEDENINGGTALFVALLAEEECKNNKITCIHEYKNMNEIIDYNEIDCKVLWDILKYIRTNMLTD